MTVALSDRVAYMADTTRASFLTGADDGRGSGELGSTRGAGRERTLQAVQSKRATSREARLWGGRRQIVTDIDLEVDEWVC